MSAQHNAPLVMMTTEDFFNRLETVIEAKLAERLAPQPEADALPELLNRKQAATYLNCSIATIDNLTRAGLLEKHYLAGLPRFKREEVKAAFANWKKYDR